MTRAMYERAYGPKCEKGYRDAAQIAKLMRGDIKAAIANGQLPGSMKNYSVRTRKYAGGQSIDLNAKDLDGMYQQCEGIVPGSEDGHTARACGNVWCAAGGKNAESPHAEHHRVLTVEGQRVKKILDGIHWAYNWDGSESQIDYFDRLYWGHADVIDPERGW